MKKNENLITRKIVAEKGAQRYTERLYGGIPEVNHELRCKGIQFCIQASAANT